MEKEINAQESIYYLLHGLTRHKKTGIQVYIPNCILHVTCYSVIDVTESYKLSMSMPYSCKRDNAIIIKNRAQITYSDENNEVKL
jgi:hypothetical protein